MNASSVFFTLALVCLGLVGCASVPLESAEANLRAKKFSAPAEGYSGVYVYRADARKGSALKKDVWIDGNCIGESATGVFFYIEVEGDREHTLATESEFSPNLLQVFMEAGKNYFIRQYIKFGVFVGGANLELVDPERGRSGVEPLPLAVSGTCSKAFPN